MEHGLIFNVQKYSVHDGPGIRTTVFLKGCPLHCAWCHNPESVSPGREIIVLESRCIGCEECRRACPHGGVIPGSGPLPPRNEVCELCGGCVEACPTQGRQMVGREMSVEEVVKIVLQDRIFNEDSNGGVTFSGGEPLSQPRFLRALLVACHAQGLHTVVDTCGLARQEDLLAIAPLTGLFLYDLKLMDDVKHQRHTGVSNRIILDNLRTLARVHRPIWLRVPVIPGINDDESNLKAAARFAADIPSVQQVNLLPFHRRGSSKAQRLGKTNGMAEAQPPSGEAMEKAADIFRNFGLTVKIGG